MKSNHQVCILTEETAQFQNPAFPGHQLVYQLPLSVQYNGRKTEKFSSLHISDFPVSATGDNYLKLHSPSVEEIQHIIQKLCYQYSEVIALMSSPYVSPTISTINQISQSSGEKFPLRIIDTQTTAVGLGYLVQQAAEAASQNTSGDEIIRILRNLISHIYTIFVTQSLTYLYRSGFIDPAQALVGELKKITPIFLLNKGKPILLQKARSNRHLSDILFEFISEFEYLNQIAIIQANHPIYSSAKNLCDRIKREIEDVTFGQYHLDASLAAILGPSCLGLIVVEKPL